MAINYELERAIRAAKKTDPKAAKFLKSQKNIFNAAETAGIVKDLPREENVRTLTTEHVLYVPTPSLLDSPEEELLPLRTKILQQLLKTEGEIEVDWKKVKEKRIHKELRQKTLAQALGLKSKARISQMENSLAPKWTSIAKAMTLAQLLESPLEDFILIPMSYVIKTWRNEKGLKQSDIVQASKGSISKGEFSRIEAGKIRTVNEKNLNAIAQGLGISVSLLRSRILPDKQDRLQGLAYENKNSSIKDLIPEPLVKNEWLTVKEAADHLRVHPKTIYRYVKLGNLRQYNAGGKGRPRFLRKDLDELMKYPSSSSRPAVIPRY